MLTEEQQHVLMAYLDDELTLAQRERVDAVLRDSEEWKQEHAQMRQIKDWVSQLPRASLPADLSDKLRKIAESHIA